VFAPTDQLVLSSTLVGGKPAQLGPVDLILDFGTFSRRGLELENITKLLTIAGLAFGLATCASADIVWTLNDVVFFGGETATGSFTTDNTADTLESFSIAVSGGLPIADFTASGSDSVVLPGDIAFFNPPLSIVNLGFVSDLTSAGGTVGVGFGSDGLLGLLVDSDHTPEVIGVKTAATPEPSGIPFLAGGLILMGFLLRQKLIRAS
jgi:hypothetical protein